MSTQDTARTALAAIMEQHSTGVVTVVSGSESANGFKGVGMTGSDLTGYGEQGAEENVVRVDASAISEPARGATITIGGDKVFVMRSRLDPVGATRFIEYSKQQPVSGL